MDDGERTAAVATLAAAAGLAIGANREKVVEFLAPPVECIRKAAGATLGGAFRFALQQKEALEDKIAEVRVKIAV